MKETNLNWLCFYGSNQRQYLSLCKKHNVYMGLWHFRCSYYKSLAIKVFSYVLRVLALAFDA